MSNSKSGWIGVDLDGTLAHYEGWNGVNHIGAPIAPMVDRVKNWLAAGKTVKIFTARMHGHGMPIIGGGVEDVKTPIEEWCRQHIGAVLEITNVKDFGMIELWDDRAIQVESNTGIPVASCKDRKRRVQLKPRNGIGLFEVGDLVEPIPGNGFFLRTGCGYYENAVCVSLDPLVLVSWDADMRWSETIKPEYFRRKGQVAASVMRRCKKRLFG